ncbi:MAG: hypothetical protein HY076_00720 [Candidatus Eisenbacteria bacterium]|uniref:PurM-like C-terminal domain-containing protein n=1 Tax=Eiseniibacteriota bacterium TaxID=2212470 RepID=A0A9D6L4P0_UNCEI|nr:hypothetical protein [Candidatus Eisenbacteria bacterium]
MDVSDGLAADLGRLCEASGVGADLDDAAWADDPALAAAAAACGTTLESLRDGASDDYELLLTVDPEHRAAVAAVAAGEGVPLTFLGVMTGAPGVLTRRGADGRAHALAARGYDHFGAEG